MVADRLIAIVRKWCIDIAIENDRGVEFTCKKTNDALMDQKGTSNLLIMARMPECMNSPDKETFYSRYQNMFPSNTRCFSKSRKYVVNSVRFKSNVFYNLLTYST